MIASEERLTTAYRQTLTGCINDMNSHPAGIRPRIDLAPRPVHPGVDPGAGWGSDRYAAAISATKIGARLIDVGYADLRLLVDRPPRTLEAAQRIAAEQVVLAHDCVDGMRDIPNIAARLVNAPIWTFWWD